MCVCVCVCVLICVFEGYIRIHVCTMYIVITAVYRHKGPIAGGGMLSGECPLCHWYA